MKKLLIASCTLLLAPATINGMHQTVIAAAIKKADPIIEKMIDLNVHKTLGLDVDEIMRIERTTERIQATAQLTAYQRTPEVTPSEQRTPKSTHPIFDLALGIHINVANYAPKKTEPDIDYDSESDCD